MATHNTFPLDRFENVQQLGGIQTASILNGSGHNSRVAFVDTGAGLRYTVALDRGADIVNASYNQHALAYLTQNRLRKPSHAYCEEWEWLAGWPGGLVTTCGPSHFGHPRDEQDGQRTRTNLHGRFSNSPAELEMIINPDPHRGRNEMLLSGIIRDSRTFGPVIEVKRTIQSALGENSIRLFDQALNRDNKPAPFGLMYHCNFGWPLLDRGAKLILDGHVTLWPADMQTAPVPRTLDGFKEIPAPHASFNSASRGFICRLNGDSNGMAHIGLHNPKLKIAFELTFSVEHLPRVMIWQHFAQGTYVLGIEPMVGSPFGKAVEPGFARMLEPGESHNSELTMKIHSTPQAIAAFKKRDKPLKLEK